MINYYYRLVMSTERNISAGLRTLILKMLEKDPKKRVTVSGLLDDHWLNEGCKHALSEEK